MSNGDMVIASGTGVHAFVPGATGIGEAPTDGQAYGRDNAAWVPVVNKAGDTMSGSLTIVDPNTSGSIVLKVSDTQYHGYSQLDSLGRLMMSYAGGTATWVAADGAGNVNISNGNGGIVLGLGQLNTVILKLNASGDLVATATAGANNGKSVNLTAGKWA